MFCPDGYLTLYEVAGGLAEIADERVNAKAPPEAPEDGSFYIDTGEYWRIERQAYSDWLFSLFLCGQWNNLYAASPQGVILRLSRDVTAAKTSYSGPFPETEESQESLISHLRFGLEYVDSQLFLIDPYKASSNYDEFGYDLIGKALVPLTGWPVCWKPPKENISNSDLHQICLNVFDQSQTFEDGLRDANRRKRGRPALGDGEIKNIISREFARRQVSGKLSGVKREAIVQEAIDWANHLTGGDFKRATMQRYLESTFAAMDAHK